jgi:hypothetical protein
LLYSYEEIGYFQFYTSSGKIKLNLKLLSWFRYLITITNRFLLSTAIKQETMAAGDFNAPVGDFNADAPAPAFTVPLQQFSGLLSSTWVVYDADASGISALPGVVRIGIYTADEFVALMQRAAPIFAQTDQTPRGEMPRVDDAHNPSIDQLRRLAGWAGAWGVFSQYADAYQEAEMRGLIPVEPADPFHLDVDDENLADENMNALPTTEPDIDIAETPVHGIPVHRT